jgi:hypothetical protein
MQGPVTLGDFKKVTADRAKFYTDENIMGGQMKMCSKTGELLVAKDEGKTIEQYELLPHGLGTLSTKLHIPTMYALRCPPDLRATNFNHWLEEVKAREYFVRFDGYPDNKKKKIRAVLSNRYADLSNEDVAEALVQNMDSEYDMRIHHDIQPERMVCEIVSESAKYNKDGHQGAIRLMNSEIGLNSLVFEAMVYWKALKSGIIIQEKGGMSERHIGNKKVFGDAFKKTIMEIMDSFENNLKSLGELKGIEVEDVEDMVKVIEASYGFNKDQRISVQLARAEIKPTTLYDMVMVFTSASCHPSLSAAERETMQRIGGEIVTNVKRYKRWAVLGSEMKEVA